jgi:restriction endonuclease S subunit
LNQHIFRVDLNKDRLDSDYAVFAINEQLEEMIGRAHGAVGLRHVTRREVESLEIPLPPLGEQRRIAARLREQLSILAEARAALEAQLAAAESLPAAHLRAVFESDEMQHWPLTRLGDLLVLRQDIVHPRNKPSGAARFVGLEHIESNTGQRVGALQIRMEDLTGRKARFFTGDIVYGYLRPYLNKVWIAEFDALCSVDQYVFEVRGDIADTNFVAWFMRSSTYLSRAPIKETPGWLPRIRTDEVAAVEMNLPPVEIQHSIADKLDAEFARTRALQQTIAAKLADLEKLPAALLREAFSPSCEVD